MRSLDGLSAIELSLARSVLREVERENEVQSTGNAGCRLMMETRASASGSRKVFASIDIHPAHTTRSGLSARTIVARSLSYSVLAESPWISLYGIKLLERRVSDRAVSLLGSTVSGY